MGMIYTQGKRIRHGTPVNDKAIGPFPKESKPSAVGHAIRISRDEWMVTSQPGFIAYDDRKSFRHGRTLKPELSKLTTKPIRQIQEIWQSPLPENPATGPEETKNRRRKISKITRKTSGKPLDIPKNRVTNRDIANRIRIDDKPDATFDPKPVSKRERVKRIRKLARLKKPKPIRYDPYGMPG